MEDLDTGKDKIKKICEILKIETLEPAKEEAQKVIEMAQQQAETIIRDAESKSNALFLEAKEKIEKEKMLFKSSIEQACRQGMEALRQDIENKLFNETIVSQIKKGTSDTKLIASLIKAMIQAIEKEGISADFSAVVAQTVKPEEINPLLGSEVLSKLHEKSVIVGDFIGGIQLKLHDKKLTLDLSNTALKELLGRYLHKNFREYLFQAIPEE